MNCGRMAGGAIVRSPPIGGNTGILTLETV
jgi:hypothetical protein